MSISKEVTATLRAQEHGHPPVICFDVYNMNETGTVSKTLNSIATDTDHVPIICMGGTNTRVKVTNGDVSPTILARAGTGGGNEPIVAIEQKGKENGRK